MNRKTWYSTVALCSIIAVGGCKQDETKVNIPKQNEENGVSKTNPIINNTVNANDIVATNPAGDNGAGVTPPSSEPSPSSGGSSTKPSIADLDHQAISNCLSIWQNAPFTDAIYNNFKKMDVSVKVLGIGTKVEDLVETPSPQLILIEPAVAVMSSAKYVLMNPNGWYCFKIGVNVMANVKVNLHCTAKIAASKVNVSVAGTSGNPATGNSGVNVMSSFKVTHSKDANSDGGC